VQRYVGSPEAVDHVIVNDVAELPTELVDGYAAEHAYPVTPDIDACRQLGPMPHLKRVASANSLLRHDATLLANEILRLVEYPSPNPNQRLLFHRKRRSERQRRVKDALDKRRSRA